MLDMPFSEAVHRYPRVNTKDLTEIDEQSSKAHPFVKWVGGKRSIIIELTSRLPEKFNSYFEPFVGGGALYFEIQENIQKAYLSDTNIDLLITYQAIKNNPQELLKTLKRHAENHNSDYYYEVRAQHYLKDPIEVAARFIYLNRTCFNGLYRVNKKGEFNVPMGTYKNPIIVNEPNIMACSSALKNTDIKLGDYHTVTPKKGDFVYFDPPYHPTTETSFTAYSQDGFSEKNQIELSEFFAKLHKNGVYVMLSNSNTDFIRSLYKKFNIAIVDAPRNVNCKPNKRNAVEEVLITNY
jgi:DNA adenine methylase